jgi:hypothetical protein
MPLPKPGDRLRTAFGRAGATTAGVFVHSEGMATAMVTKRGEASRNNVKTESLGRQNIEGVDADGTRTTITIPAGQIGNDRPIEMVDERWYSPELQVVVMTRHTDPRIGETVYKLTNISRSEPPGSLFEVPADFKITEPRAQRIMIHKE